MSRTTDGVFGDVASEGQHVDQLVEIGCHQLCRLASHLDTIVMRERQTRAARLRERRNSYSHATDTLAHYEPRPAYLLRMRPRVRNEPSDLFVSSQSRKSGLWRDRCGEIVCC